MKQSDLGITPAGKEYLSVGLRLATEDVERVRRLMERRDFPSFTFFGQACRYLVRKGLEAEGL